MAADVANPPCALIVMGVSGSGKSTVGEALAKCLGWLYEDGDSVRCGVAGPAAHDAGAERYQRDRSLESERRLALGETVVAPPNPRELPMARSPESRISDWEEFHEHADEAMLRDQGRNSFLPTVVLSVLRRLARAEDTPLIRKYIMREAEERADAALVAVHVSSNWPIDTPNVGQPPKRRLQRPGGVLRWLPRAQND